MSSPSRSIPKEAHRTPGAQAGLSLVELMIGVALGLVIVGALIGFFVSTSRNNRELAQVNRQIEAGRFAIQLLENDIVHAGFWGSYVPQFDDLSYRTAPTDVPNAIPEVCLAWNVNSSPPVPWPPQYQVNMLGIPVQAYDGVPAGCATSFLPDRQANTDVLLVRHGATCEFGEAGCASGSLYFQASQCNKELTADPPRRFVMDTDAASFVLRQKGCRIVDNVSEGAALAPRRRVVSHVYYVRDYANFAGDGIPTLMRLELGLSANGKVEFLAPEALVEGIQGFSVELGIDDRSATGAAVNYTQAIAWQDPNNKVVATNRGDGSPDSYIRCTAAAPCTAAQLMNAVAVRLHVLARSLERSPGHLDTKTYLLGDVALGPYNDDIKRHVFTTLLRLHNVSGRR